MKIFLLSLNLLVVSVVFPGWSHHQVTMLFFFNFDAMSTYFWLSSIIFYFFFYSTFAFIITT